MFSTTRRSYGTWRGRSGVDPLVEHLRDAVESIITSDSQPGADKRPVRSGARIPRGDR